MKNFKEESKMKQGISDLWRRVEILEQEENRAEKKLLARITNIKNKGQELKISYTKQSKNHGWSLENT